ncbi:Chemotaxis protein [Desulfonema limicola]|uniref:Chemotaxis protein n=1 Tax=Desulfonema limicola TaxID=45656 RepID=A0A975B839_9BACT|nr:chemotaxis protein CheW [Desulfonema limicola]QTA80387.1 Chemotaxis protein [Desulfonema limicola]
MNNSIQAGIQRVLVYPARTPVISGKRIFFLFSLNQIENIISKLEIYPLPFAPSHIKGLAQWEEQVVPVLSLEKCLELPDLGRQSSHMRLILVRSENKNIKGLLSADSAIRLIPRPDSCFAGSSLSWLSHKESVRGVYEWDEGFLIIVNINNILNGELTIKGGKPWNA